MICPECRAEYRQGFRRCADCDVELVDTLPAAAPQPGEFDGDLVTIWTGDDQSRCLELCLELKDAGIRYDVSQSVKSRLGMSVNWRYELGVPSDAVEAAKKLLELPDTVTEENSELTEEDEEQALPEHPDREQFAADDARIRRNYDSYLDPWYPEDATVEIWMRSADDDSTTVELSLKANCIRAREEMREDGSKMYLVMPEMRPQREKLSARLLRAHRRSSFLPNRSVVICNRKHDLPQM